MSLESNILIICLTKCLNWLVNNKLNLMKLMTQLIKCMMEKVQQERIPSKKNQNGMLII
jgi:hypothetical protein